jgi:hypothetical protein
MFFDAKQFSLTNLRILTDQAWGITDEIKPVQYTFDAKIVWPLLKVGRCSEYIYIILYVVQDWL